MSSSSSSTTRVTVVAPLGVATSLFSVFFSLLISKIPSPLTPPQNPVQPGSGCHVHAGHVDHVALVVVQLDHFLKVVGAQIQKKNWPHNLQVLCPFIRTDQSREARALDWLSAISLSMNSSSCSPLKTPSILWIVCSMRWSVTRFWGKLYVRIFSDRSPVPIYTAGQIMQNTNKYKFKPAHYGKRAALPLLFLAPSRRCEHARP